MKKKVYICHRYLNWKRSINNNLKTNNSMERRFLWIMATILTLCGAAMLTSCSNDDGDSANEPTVSEKIVGKWIVTERDGQPLPTNKKAVYTFVSPSKAYVSSSITTHPELGALWGDEIDVNVVINDNKLTMDSHPDENMTVMEEFIISDINGSEFTANYNLTIMVDGNVVSNDEMVLRFMKVVDHSTDILGLWECTGLTGDETYNDANARLEFFADGTYKYWCANELGVWQTVTTREFQDYFVEGTLLATRWKDVDDDELREWWEIVSISDNEMVWKALRKNEYRKTFEQEMTWKRVK